MRIGLKRTPRGVPVVGGGGWSSGTPGSTVTYRKTLTVGDGTGGTYTPAQLAAGVELFTPAVGDVIANIGIKVPVAFDTDGGSNPACFDFGYFDTVTTGALQAIGGGSYNFTLDEDEAGRTISDDGLLVRDYADDFISQVGFNDYGVRTLIPVEISKPLKVVISEDATIGGTAIASTVGTVVVYVIVHPAASMVDLDA